MPARTTAPETRVPTCRLICVNQLPEREIIGVFLIVFVRVNSARRAGNIAFKIDFREFAVFGKRRNAVINRTVRLVSVSVFEQLFDNRNHFRDMFSRPRRDFGTFKSERVKIFPKRCDKRLYKFVNRLVRRFRFLDNSVINVRQIHHVRQIIIFIFQITPQNVAKRKCPKIADVRETPNRRTADIKPHIIVFQRLKFFEFI